MNFSKSSRRQFLGKAMGIAASVGVPLREQVLSAQPPAAAAGDIPYRQLGRSGERVSLVGLGGYHIGVPTDPEEGIRLVRTALDSGINFLDNCWDYHDGDSEVRMGKALRDGYRKKAFLMTKIDGRTKDAAARQIDESLRRLQTDVIDLMQFHEVIRPNDPDRFFAPNGAFEAMTAAKQAGKIRYIGFTGHKDPDIHLKMLNMALQRGFTFDAVQMPLNVMDAHFRSFAHKVVPVLTQHRIGVLGMKPLGSGIILQSHAVTAVECLHYAMNLPTSVVITGCDKPEILQQALEAARTFKPLAPSELAALLAKTAPFAAQGKFEPFKTTTDFDGTAHNPQWLG